MPDGENEFWVAIQKGEILAEVRASARSAVRASSLTIKLMPGPAIFEH